MARSTIPQVQIPTHQDDSSDEHGILPQTPRKPVYRFAKDQSNASNSSSVASYSSSPGISDSSSPGIQNTRQRKRPKPARTPRGASDVSISFADETEDDDDDATWSAESAGEQAERKARQRIPPIMARSMAKSMMSSEAADRSGISESLQQVYNKRSEVQSLRRNLASIWAVLKQKRKEKSEVDRKLHVLALSCSMNGKVPSREEVVVLFEKSERLRSGCDSLEQQHDDLRSKLEQKTARLEAHESGLLRSFASGAAESYASGTKGRLSERPMTKGATRQPTGKPASQQPGKPVSQHTGRRIPSSVPPAQPDRPISLQQRRTMDSVLMGISGDRPRNEHPVFGKLQQTVGELKIAEEGYKELELEREDIINGLQTSILRERSRKGEAYKPVELQASLKGDYRSDEFKKSFARHLTPDDLNYLQEWYAKAEDSRSKITAKQKQVGQMREWCKSMDVLPEYMPFEEQENVLGSVIPKEKDADMIVEDMEAAAEKAASMANKRAALAHKDFPWLVTNAYFRIEFPMLTTKRVAELALKTRVETAKQKLVREDSVKEYGIETMLTRAVEGRKPDYINRWLLQQLRMSSLEVVRLFLIMSDTLRIINLLRWQDDVVYYWPLDDTNQWTSYRLAYSFSDTSDTPRTHASLVADSSDGRVLEGEI